MREEGRRKEVALSAGEERGRREGGTDCKGGGTRGH